MSNASSLPPKSPKTILVVDDDAVARTLVARALGRYHHVIEAKDGMQALEILGTIPPPDLLVCDVMMPVVDGFTLVGMIRKHEELRRIPVIFITAKEGPSGMIQGIDLGARAYVTKPIDYAELTKTVNRLLR